jgi:flavin-dependent dehydrogenase
VVVLDRSHFPRDKTCAGWITPQVVETLQLDLAEYARTRTCQPITAFRTGLLGSHGREVVTRYEHVVSYGIRRCEFDEYLITRSGATLQPGVVVRALRRDAEGWHLNESHVARMLVGAGGHFCPVSRELGNRKRPHVPVVHAQEIEFRADPSDLARGTVEPHCPELFFCEDLEGYGWCFRKGEYLNIGLGRVGGAQLTEHVAGFATFLRKTGKVTAPLPERWHGHAYQLYEHLPPRLYDERVLLIGDAAGLAYPQSGEGIRPAIESGLLAADVILSAEGDYSSGQLSRYADQIGTRFGPVRSRRLGGWLPAGWLRFVAARLMGSHLWTREVLLDRWFLHATQPALQHG